MQICHLINLKQNVEIRTMRCCMIAYSMKQITSLELRLHEHYEIFSEPTHACIVAHMILHPDIL